MLLELPPSVPGQPLPELPSTTATPSGVPALASSAAASTPGQTKNSFLYSTFAGLPKGKLFQLSDIF